MSDQGGAASLCVGDSSAKISRFKYVVSPGNNSRVILQALRCRPWWSPVNTTDAANSANLCWEMYKEKRSFAARAALPPGHRRAINHLENTSALVTKKGLYYSLKAHCQLTGADLWSIIPKTWHLLPQQPVAAASTDSVPASALPESIDSERAAWVAYYDAVIAAAAASTISAAEPETADAPPAAPLWIVKPAALANRGCGIRVLATQAAVLAMIDSSSNSSSGASSSSSSSRRSSSSSVAAAASSSKKELLLRRKLQRRHSTNSTNSSNTNSSNTNSSSVSSSSSSSAVRHGYIVQQYITSPLLVSGRKFDVRCFVLLVAAAPARRRKLLVQTCGESPVTDVATDVREGAGKCCNSANSSSISGTSSSGGTGTSSVSSELRAYVHCDAYARTSSTPFSTAVRTLGDRRMHLTNDAVQKGGSSFGLHEAGNKLSMQQLQVSVCVCTAVR
jgi:Tubulin-tyrosine ligase family